MLVEKFHGYEILAEIGLGAMSRVYLAYDPQNRHHVAIKMLPAEYLNDLGYRSRFEQEAQLIAALQHEAIVPLYESGVEKGKPFIVMQYMQGGSLADHLRHGPFSPEQTAKVLARIASALDYAHSQGIIHRDLKTSNVLFDQDGNAYLADFGIAIFAESTWQSNLASGTPAYMSPEQALREATIDIRSDIYSLGVITFEMLSGRLPFEGELPMSVLLQHIHDSPPSLGALNPELPATLDPVLQQALAKNPQERFSTAGEFVGTFQKALYQTGDQNQKSEIQKPDTSAPERMEVLPDPQESTPPYGSTLQEIQIRKPIFPQFVISLAKPAKHAYSMRREERYLYVLSLVTWIAIFFAAFTAAAARSQELFSPSNIQLFYDESAIAVVNVSDMPIDLSSVTFQRLSDQGTVTATFAVEHWGQVNPNALSRLPAGDCFQLLRPGADDDQLIPGTAPAKPSSCGVSQGWLVAIDKAWHFWIPDDDGAFFQVVQDGQIIHSCRIADRRCDFILSEHE